MTKEQKLQEIDRFIKRVIKTQEEHIAKYSEQAAENYMNFFHWNAGNMYEAHMILEYFNGIKEMAQCENIETITKALERMIRNIERDLIDRSAFGSCTNEIINLEHRLKLESKREIRQELQTLYRISVEKEDLTMKKSYRITIHDYYTNPEKCNTVNLEIEYPTLEMATEAGWSIIEAFAAIHGLGVENQGDQYMAYITEGEKEGWGVVTLEIYDNEGTRCENL